MIVIKPLYDNGSNGLVKITKAAHKQGKKLSDMGTNELARMCCGLL